MEYESGGMAVVALLVLALPMVWFYHAGLEASPLQGTIGKLMTGLKVTDERGNRCTLGRTTRRFLGKLLSGLMIGIGYLMIAFTDRKQGLHDKLAETLVLKR